MVIPRRGRRLRWTALVSGVVTFLWLGREDNAVWPVTLLGLTLTILIGLTLALGQLGGQTIPRRYLLPGAMLSGALVGLGTALTTAGLMLFKNAWHAHLFLDYPVGLLLAILARAPAWALAGALVGGGLALVWAALRRP
jgi:hypothetical protein